MPIYEIIITRAGVPYETWEAETETSAEAVDGCRAIRIAQEEHVAGDTYLAMLCEMSDDAAFAYAFLDAAKRLPEMYLLHAGTP